MFETSVNVQLVIAKYKEDVSWVSRINIPALIYDKSVCGMPNSLPNIGREAHTYLHYILYYYPFFPEYTVFLQGDPFSHMCFEMSPEKLGVLISNYIERKIFFKGFANYVIRCDFCGKPHNLESNKGKWVGCYKDIPVGNVYGELFSGEIPRLFHCRAPAGLFIVHSSRILCRSRSFYKKAMELVTRDPFDNMNTGHAFERLWYIIFNGNSKLNKLL